ncbi:Sec-independent protein translocase subunit TatA [Thalassiella azotivora]
MFRNLADNPLLLILLVLIIVLVFGANRLPGAARSLGRSMRIFKSEVKEMKDDDGGAKASSDSSAPLEGRVHPADRRHDTDREARPGEPTRSAESEPRRDA